MVSKYIETKIGNGRFFEGDCFDVMPDLPDGSVDMVLCDLPYGTTQNKWDSVLPLDRLWAEYWRVCKPNAAIVLTAAQPFTSSVVMSQVDRFRYEWIWEKEPSGNLNAKKMPMAAHESVLVFGKPVYRPQGLRPTLRKRGAKDNSRTTNYGHQEARAYDQTVTGYPSSMLAFAKDRGGLHPTQKPVALFEYMIRTYTDEGMVVLDNTAGSGTTAIAAENAGRRWICIERDPDYTKKAIQRIRDHIYAKTCSYS